MDTDINKVETLVDHPHRLEQMVSKAIDTGMTLGTTYGLRAVGALVIFVAGWFVARQVQRALVRVGRKSERVDLTIATFLGTLSKYLIIAFTLIAVLASFGVET